MATAPPPSVPATTAPGPVAGRATDTAWLRLVQVSLAASVVPLVVFAVTGTFFTTISEGEFRYAADYWYTAMGVPLAVVGIAHTVGVHRLQHGADGRLGTIGVWINAIALTELFAQLVTSVATGAEVRWGPAYPIFTALTFLGVALLAAGSWRTGLLPRWLLGPWPLAWVLGTFAGYRLVPLALIAYFAVFGLLLTRRVEARSR